MAPVTPTISLQSVDSGIVGDSITNVNVISLTGTAEINSTIKVYDGATLLGSAMANAEGVWNFKVCRPNNVADDQMPLPVFECDDHRSVYGPGQRACRHVVGTADPDSKVSIYDSANGRLLGSTVANADGKWLFISPADDRHSTFTVNEDFNSKFRQTIAGRGQPLASKDQAWGFTTGHMPDGVHNFTAVSTDLAGNISATSAALVSHH